MFLPPSRYVFKGAEVFEGEDSDDDSGDESDDGDDQNVGSSCAEDNLSSMPQADVKERLSADIADPCQVSIIDQSDTYVEISTCEDGNSSATCKSSHQQSVSTLSHGESVSLDSQQVTTSHLTNDVGSDSIGWLQLI